MRLLVPPPRENDCELLTQRVRTPSGLINETLEPRTRRRGRSHRHRYEPTSTRNRGPARYSRGSAWSHIRRHARSVGRSVDPGQAALCLVHRCAFVSVPARSAQGFEPTTLEVRRRRAPGWPKGRVGEKRARADRPTSSGFGVRAPVHFVEQRCRPPGGACGPESGTEQPEGQDADAEAEHQPQTPCSGLVNVLPPLAKADPTIVPEMATPRLVPVWRARRPVRGRRRGGHRCARAPR